MPGKHKFGRHSAHVTPGVRASLELISSWPNVSRVIVGSTRGGSRGKAYDDGHVRIQSRRDYLLNAIAYGGSVIFELKIVINSSDNVDAIEAEIAKNWPIGR